MSKITLSVIAAATLAIAMAVGLNTVIMKQAFAKTSDVASPSLLTQGCHASRPCAQSSPPPANLTNTTTNTTTTTGNTSATLSPSGHNNTSNATFTNHQIQASKPIGSAISGYNVANTLGSAGAGK